jgi:hypothetical protein
MLSLSSNSEDTVEKYSNFQFGEVRESRLNGFLSDWVGVTVAQHPFVKICEAKESWASTVRFQRLDRPFEQLLRLRLQQGMQPL